MLDGLVTDVKTLSQELERVIETAKSEADRLEEKGLLGKMSVLELSEQRTEIRQISGLPHYNKIDHITGRTPMERFSLRAAALVDSAKGTIDELKTMYSGVLEYFGEDENMPSNEFFGTMRKFILEFNLAAEQVEKMEKARVSAVLSVLYFCLPSRCTDILHFVILAEGEIACSCQESRNSKATGLPSQVVVAAKR